MLRPNFLLICIWGLLIGCKATPNIPATPTTFEYRVRVVEEATRKPINLAQVILLSGAGTGLSDAVTDDRGIAILQIDANSVNKTYPLAISADGYIGWEQNITLQEGSDMQTIILQPFATVSASEMPASVIIPTVNMTPTSSLIDSNFPPIGATLGTSWTRPIDNMTMWYVPAGSFLMGSEDGEPNEQSVHPVTLSHFWVDETEVTNAQYATFLIQKFNQKQWKASWVDMASDNALIIWTGESFIPLLTAEEDYSQHPMIEVSWHGAQAYCNWIGGGLPTEAQWEYVARGSENLTYPWGDEFNVSHLNCSNDVCNNDTYNQTIPVGSFPQGASWVGALDMVGNVWEWVHDWYGSNYPNFAQADPLGPEQGVSRVLRGGSWMSGSANTRTTYRLSIAPSYMSNDIGFRCVIPATQ